MAPAAEHRADLVEEVVPGADRAGGQDEVSMTTMPRTAMTALPNLLRILNASNGLKAIAGPRFTTAVLGGGALRA